MAFTNIQGIIRVEGDSENSDNEQEQKEQRLADKLRRILKRRLATHIKSKIIDPSKHNHPALLFVRANLNRFAALLYIFKQGRMSPVMHPNSCLLQPPSIGGYLVAVDNALE